MSNLVGSFFGVNKRAKQKIAWPAPEPMAVSQKKVNLLAMLTPIVPLIMVLGLKVDIITGFVVGILYCMATTINKDSLKQLTKSIIEGISNSAGAIFLIIGIGML